ncbi:MAG: hypothetical protein EOP55_20340 [Sphingobacteriales bacterium]|nr:MAG: hypothetical protein EOP55_20340 [Sphingobacteriales bacterium]
MKQLKSWNILSRLKFHLTNSVLITLGVLVVLMCACKQKTHDYYAGIIIDEFGKPIEGVFVKEDWQINMPVQPQLIRTDFSNLKRVLSKD